MTFQPYSWTRLCCTSAWTRSPLLSDGGELLDRPDLDAPQACRRHLRSHADGLVEIAGIDQVEPAQLLFRLGKRVIGDGDLAIPDRYGCGHLNWLQGIRGNVVAALPKLLAVIENLIHQRVVLARRQRIQLAFLVIDQA